MFRKITVFDNLNLSNHTVGHWCILFFFIFQVMYNAVISHSGTGGAKSFLKNAVKTQDFALVRNGHSILGMNVFIMPIVG